MSMQPYGLSLMLVGVDGSPAVDCVPVDGRPGLRAEADALVPCTCSLSEADLYTMFQDFT